MGKSRAWSWRTTSKAVARLSSWWSPARPTRLSPTREWSQRMSAGPRWGAGCRVGSLERRGRIQAGSKVGPSTRGRPSRAVQSFSRAMASRVSPRYCWWSRPTLVSTVRMGSVALVASQRPPMPTSTRATSTPVMRKADRAAVIISSK